MSEMESRAGRSKLRQPHDARQFRHTGHFHASEFGSSAAIYV